MEKSKGTVKFFNERGWGFIRADDGREIFVHHSGIESNDPFRSLDANDRVEYDLEQAERGPKAINVKVIPRECAV